jgi:two-component system, response regulator PdtaR
MVRLDCLTKPLRFNYAAKRLQSFNLSFSITGHPFQAMSPKLKILVAEDDAILAYALELVVHESGYEMVGPFPTAAGALAAIGEIGPDIAFVDIGLDGLTNGVALAQVLTARFGTTVYLVSGDRRTAMGSPGAAYGFIEKPATEATFRAALAHAMAVRDGAHEPPPAGVVLLAAAAA